MSRLFTFRSQSQSSVLWYSDYLLHSPYCLYRVSAWGCLRKILNSKYFENGKRWDQQEDDGASTSTCWWHRGQFEWWALDSGTDGSATRGVRQFEGGRDDIVRTELTTRQTHVLPNCLDVNFVISALFNILKFHNHLGAVGQILLKSNKISKCQPTLWMFNVATECVKTVSALLSVTVIL